MLGGESIPDVRVHIQFTNADDRRMRVLRYRILWPGGNKLLEPDDLVIEPHAERPRTARIGYQDGDPDVLLREPSKVRVEVLSAERL